MLISIIVPIYNMENYIEKCIQSLINQTYKNIEIILINDGSSDNSLKICEIFANVDKRIKVINKINEGVAAARNTGLEVANGELIGFVDPDDYVELNMFEKLVESMEKEKSEIAICGYIIENEKGEFIKLGDKPDKIITYNTEQAMKALINNGNFTSYPWDKLYKRSLFEDIRYPKGKIYEDADTTYKLIHKCKKVSYNSEPVYHYVKREKSITHTFKPEMMYRLEIDERLAKFININYPQLYNDVEPIWYRTNIQILISMYKSNCNDDKMYYQIIRNIKINLKYILREKKIISNKEKIIALMSCFSKDLVKILVKIIYNIKLNKLNA